MALLNTPFSTLKKRLTNASSRFLICATSHINGGLLCVQHHLRRALEAGVPAVKVEHIGAWRRAGVFSVCEQSGAFLGRTSGGRVPTVCSLRCVAELARVRQRYADLGIVYVLEL
ncbi:carboxymuconolactone decarboxylase family protein [Paraburkholderia panacisoli]|uniref:Carboxymuconolactone decarboxylase family protein n=1 Tax=Paraburkholderia panacisoli TaxID=2603818 RepID=A0A5B0G4M7_9BURK|nr:carboxymuconolactone decarboxylase family protein [Paraburkholderia panacisoli]KAA0997658.1 carboxymuconolactone decarboxylase family protein [Paraburkholderia panacisoli]